MLQGDPDLFEQPIAGFLDLIELFFRKVLQFAWRLSSKTLPNLRSFNREMTRGVVPGAFKRAEDG